MQIRATSPIGLYISEGYRHQTRVTVAAPTRDKIESVFSIFDGNAEKCRFPEEVQRDTRVFIGHGGDSQWRDLKDHLHEKHDYTIEAYEIGSRAGQPSIGATNEKILSIDLLLLASVSSEPPGPLDSSGTPSADTPFLILHAAVVGDIGHKPV